MAKSLFLILNLWVLHESMRYQAACQAVSDSQKHFQDEIYCKQVMCSRECGSTREISNGGSVTATVVSDLNISSETEFSTS